MIALASKRPLRALLRRARAGYCLGRLALTYPPEIGWRRAAIRAARRLTGARAKPSAMTGGEDAALRPPAGSEFDAIYAIGYWPGEPKRYRVFNRAEALRAAGYSVHVMPFERLDDIRHYRWTARALVLFRAEYDPLVGIEEGLAYARGAGMRIVYDIDDLVFDPGLADRIDGLRRMGPHQRRQFIAAMARYRRLLLACDLVTVSTAPLADAAEALGRRSVVVPNSLNSAQLRLAAEIADAPRAARDVVRVGYFSGTRTHQRDFAVCEAALLDIMGRHRELRFRLVGHLDLGPQWQNFGDRIERIGLLAPAELLRCIAATDINLAPLELGNPFSEAKSELKFFEAAIVEVPTVASATQTFAAAVEDGVTGFLARDPEGWRRALGLLASCESRRKTMGRAARAQALARYTPAAVTPGVVAALGLGEPCRADGSVSVLASAVST